MEKQFVNPIKNPKNFSLLDPGAFEKFFGGIDHKMAVNIYVKTATIFLKNIDLRMQTITDGLNNFDNQSAIVTAHQVKGSLLSLGGNSLADSFRQIEMSVNLTPNNELLDLLNGLKPELNKFCEELKIWVQELQNSV